MTKQECQTCFKNQTFLTCNHCEEASCKKCSCFVDQEEFSFSEMLPESIKEGVFCPRCFDAHISQTLSDYKRDLELAKSVNVYDKTQGAETRLIRRIEKPITIEKCDDREETLMRLALLAAQKGYNTLVDTDIRSKKIGEGTYKKLIWSGTAVPVNIKKRK